MFKHMEELLATWRQNRTPLNYQMLREALEKDREELVASGAGAEIAERFKGLQQCVEIQCQRGNYDYSPYMYGMANGLILALHIMSGSTGDPPYLDKPVDWLSESADAENETAPTNPNRRLGDGTAAHVK